MQALPESELCYNHLSTRLTATPTLGASPCTAGAASWLPSLPRVPLYALAFTLAAFSGCAGAVEAACGSVACKHIAKRRNAQPSAPLDLASAAVLRWPLRPCATLALKAL